MIFSFSNFPPTDPPTLPLGYKAPLFLAVFRVEPNLCPLLQNAIVVALPLHSSSASSPRMNTFSFNSESHRKGTLWNSCTHGGYSPAGSEKKSPSLTFLPPSYLSSPARASPWVKTLEANWWQQCLFDGEPRGQPPATHFTAEMDKHWLWGGVNREETDIVQDISQLVLRRVRNAWAIQKQYKTIFVLLGVLKHK